MLNLRSKLVLTVVGMVVLVAILIVLAPHNNATVRMIVPGNPTDKAEMPVVKGILHGAYSSSDFRFTLSYAPLPVRRSAICLSEAQGFPGFIVGLPELPMVTLVFEGDMASMYDISEIDLESATPNDFLGQNSVVTKKLTGMDFPVEFFVTAYDESGGFAGSMSVSVDDC